MDKELVEMIKRGDETALELIIKKYSGYVCAVISNQLGKFSDISTIEDLASDVFLVMWQKRMNFTTYHLKGWLGATARNKAREYIRNKKIIFEKLDENTELYLIDDNFKVIEAEEEKTIIQNAIDSLSDCDREIILRYYYYNQNTRQIAEETEQNISAVKSRLSRARIKLKENLKKEGF